MLTTWVCFYCFAVVPIISHLKDVIVSSSVNITYFNVLQMHEIIQLVAHVKGSRHTALQNEQTVESSPLKKVP